MTDNRIELHNRVNLIKPGKLRRHPNTDCGNGGEPLIHEHLCMGDNRIKLHNRVKAISQAKIRHTRLVQRRITIDCVNCVEPVR